jgi:hypothetical protein
MFEPITLKQGTDPGADVELARAEHRRSHGDATHRYANSYRASNTLSVLSLSRGGAAW